MTTIVARGTGRKANAEKVAKAAQRTPLPPRVVARKAADPEPSPEGTRKPLRAGKRKLGVKEQAFADCARESGWRVIVEVDEILRTVITASRGTEIVRVWFTPNSALDLTDMPSYFRNGLEGKRVKLRNVSAAKKQVSLPETDRPIKSVLVGRKASVSVEDSPRRNLPFDVDTAKDAEILEYCNGAKIQWRNSLTHLVETAYALPNAKHNKVTPNRDLIGLKSRLLHFVAVQGGFHVVQLDRLLSVTPPSEAQKAIIAKSLSDAGIAVRP